MNHIGISTLTIIGLSFLISCQSSVAVSLENSSDVGSSISPTIQSEIYQNPIFNNDFPDPSIIRHRDGAFYAYSTGSHIIKSIDLVNWEYIGQALPTRPTWGTYGANIWAPHVSLIAGKYVMHYSLSRWDDPNPGIGIATASHPEGPWTDLGKFFLSDEIGVNNSIDPMTFIEDEQVFLIWGSFRGIYAIELTPDGLGFIDGSVEAAAQTKVHLAGYETSRAFDANTYEGAYVIKKDDAYYLFLSNGSCCSGSYSYNVRVARASSLLGPYEDASGRAMLTGDVGTYVVYGNSIFVAPGHNAVIADDVGDYWLLYHAFPGDDRSKRVLLIDKLIFDENGFPSLFGTTPSNNRKSGPNIIR
ncbi:MAG TPA: arabinan endo-1,5-alpha-L-arabinosidase [Firmicutes bacterium]|jgi:arabinan endo-1,5-alpha-L-arabinosidase|nr:arabinan endo-1,5-alpha-L-arabinosidase [Bacillota bacterium]